MTPCRIAALACRPWVLVVLLLVPLVAVPAIDLAVSGWFHEPGEGFPLRFLPLFEFVRKGLPAVLFGIVAYMLAMAAAGSVFGQRFLGIGWREAGFVSLSLALGPGLVVNSLLKEHWGRARPSQIVEFGGQALFSPALAMVDQCASNCSFASGHGALGFWVVAFALLAPPRWRPAAMVAALLFGLAVGMVRVAQGGHFLSDVAFAGAITVGITLLLHRMLYRP
ncbi:MAG: phosphatase PAP2 family protein [Alphaproteobacteria bacterium]|nr:phosphatase PAP2 family protein [Alphaproteobacteria bacterium]